MTLTFYCSSPDADSRVSVNMQTYAKVLIVGFLLYVASQKVKEIIGVPPIPQLDQNEWWGKAKPNKEDQTIKPFKINVDDAVLEDLRMRLKNTRPLTSALEDSQHNYGINANLMNEILEYWKTDYDFKVRQKYLNTHPHFITNIQGLDIHFIHKSPPKDLVKSQNLKVIPILLIHGWPGSIREFHEVIQKLTIPKDGYAFDIIAPSIPGYAFSKAPSRPGLGAAQVGVIMNNLMARLGYKQYYLHGEDWGAVIGAMMSVMYPENVLGFHSTMCFSADPISNVKLVLGELWPSMIADGGFDTSKIYPSTSMFSFLIRETGYFHIQATKPDTLGVALKDSPAGLAAYILERFIQWTDPEFIDRPDGGLKEHFSYDKLLDNVMLYWVTGSMPTAMRLYAETAKQSQVTFDLLRQPIEIPTSCSRFRHELAYMPTTVLKHKFLNLVQVTDHRIGGHFPGLQLPEKVADDIWTSVVKMEKK